MSTMPQVYNSTIICPICELDFEMGKVRTKTIRQTGQETDLCPIYEGENPLYYDAVVCPYCGFAQIGTTFDKVSSREIKIVKEKLTPKWMPRDFEMTRTLDQAIDAYKIVLLNYQVRQVPASDMAKLCMRLAWMYRFRGEPDIERKYLEHAFRYYQDTFLKENLPVGKLDEFTVMYMIGELARRLGQYGESVNWFGKLIAAGLQPANRGKVPPKLVDMGRDQMELAKKAAR